MSIKQMWNEKYQHHDYYSRVFYLCEYLHNLFISDKYQEIEEVLNELTYDCSHAHLIIRAVSVFRINMKDKPNKLSKINEEIVRDFFLKSQSVSPPEEKGYAARIFKEIYLKELK